MNEHCRERIDTTVGDLVAALSEAALELCGDNTVAYLLASMALEDILQRTARDFDDTMQISSARRPRTMSVH